MTAVLKNVSPRPPDPRPGGSIRRHIQELVDIMRRDRILAGRGLRESRGPGGRTLHVVENAFEESQTIAFAFEVVQPTADGIPPGTEGKVSVTGGFVEHHGYDGAAATDKYWGAAGGGACADVDVTVNTDNYNVIYAKYTIDTKSEIVSTPSNAATEQAAIDALNDTATEVLLPIVCIKRESSGGNKILSVERVYHTGGNFVIYPVASL